MEFDCYLCGVGMYASSKLRGCKMICDECREKMEQLEEANNATTTGV
jgi:hypothetical protein